jgi:repressor LexA
MATATDTLIDPAAVARLGELGLTERQASIFFHIFETTRMTGIQPSFKELGERFSITSPNGVGCHLAALSRKGWIAMAEGQSRSVRFRRTISGAPFRGFLCPED